MARIRKKTEEREVIEQIKGIIERFLNPKAHKILIFGSRREGFSRPFSDYDIGILGKRPVPLETLALIEEALEESDLPYRVDIVDLSLVTREFREKAFSHAKQI